MKTKQKTLAFAQTTNLVNDHLQDCLLSHPIEVK